MTRSVAHNNHIYTLQKSKLVRLMFVWKKHRVFILRAQHWQHIACNIRMPLALVKHSNTITSVDSVSMVRKCKQNSYVH